MRILVAANQSFGRTPHLITRDQSCVHALTATAALLTIEIMPRASLQPYGFSLGAGTQGLPEESRVWPIRKALFRSTLRMSLSYRRFDVHTNAIARR